MLKLLYRKIELLKLNNSFSVILKGAVLGQLFQIIAIPILTRFFSNGEFGVFSYFMSLNAILLTFISGKYELSLLILDNQRLKNGFLATLILTFLVFSILLLLTFFKPLIFFAIRWISFRILLLSLLTSLFMALVVLFSELFLRLSETKWYSYFKIINPLLTSIFSIVFGYFYVSNGLVYGIMLGTFITLVVQVTRLIQLKFFENVNLNLGEMKTFFLEHIKFPLFYTPGQLLNSLVGFFTVFFITKLSGPEALGLFFMADRIGALFTNTLGLALRDHFRSQAVYKIKKGELFKYHINYTGRLILLIALCISLFYVFSFYLSTLLGDDWTELEQVFRILLIYFFFQFLNLPTSGVMVVIEAQKIDFIWQLFYLATTVISFYFFEVGDDFLNIMFVFATFRSVAYLVQIILTLYLSYKSDNLYCNETSKN